MRKLLAWMLTLLLLTASFVPVLAEDGSVIYSGNAREFIFEPGSEYSPTDLFPNYKGVMPGDSLTQMITVRNARRKTIIRVYMRALGAHEDSVEFLSQLRLRVNEVGDSELFDAPANETAQLTDWVHLGTLGAGGEIDLEVILDVPVELDSRFSNAIGYLDWEFMVEEYPTGGGGVTPEPPEEEEPEAPEGPETLPPEVLPDTPHTGERDDGRFWTVVLICAAAAMAVVLLLLIGRLRRKADEEIPSERNVREDEETGV